jgi:hypothetical protein
MLLPRLEPQYPWHKTKERGNRSLDLVMKQIKRLRIYTQQQIDEKAQFKNKSNWPSSIADRSGGDLEPHEILASMKAASLHPGHRLKTAATFLAYTNASGMQSPKI